MIAIGHLVRALHYVNLTPEDELLPEEGYDSELYELYDDDIEECVEVLYRP